MRTMHAVRTITTSVRSRPKNPMHMMRAVRTMRTSVRLPLLIVYGLQIFI